ncbi:hypothetical protein EON81_17165 [bacterium]|nr:MAG: hypothetical protein EON81_17165 [bacterium]
MRVDAKYADDEPASPHDQTTMRVRGGEFCFGGSGGITGVGSARMEIDGAYFEGNNRFNPDPDTGGVSFQCGKTPEGVPTPMSGYVRNITFGDGNNGGTNLFIDDFSKQLVTLDRAASMIVKSGPP